MAKKRCVLKVETRLWNEWRVEAVRAGTSVSDLVVEAMASRGKSVEAAPKGKSPKKVEPRGVGEFRGSFPRTP